MASTAFEFLDFDNTKIAFSYKEDKELKRLKWLFSLMNNKALVNLGTTITPKLLKLKFPFLKPILKATIFKQFVGGENLNETRKTIDLLKRFDTLTILDYGAESKTSESELDMVVQETVRAIELASGNASVPVVSTKITGLADNALLIKMQTSEALTDEELVRKDKLYNRLDQICKAGYENKVGVMIDAEESWMQETIDALVEDMMAQYNKREPIVFNTYQLYRHDKLEYLKSSYDQARAEKYFLGAKLVRGAYMDKENTYAKEKGQLSVIHTSKEDTDLDYNRAVTFCVDHYENIGSVCASHNTNSNKLQAHIIEKRSLPKNHPHLNFCQLLGMSDNLTFNLAKAGYNVAKYVPYGPVEEVVPYLMRRAKENTSVTGDMSRELKFILKELKRRGLA